MALINKLEAIGDSIRAATGTTDLLTLDDMALGVDAIAEERDEYENQLNNLPLEELEITANGEYTPSEGKVGFSKVSANVEADVSGALPAEAFNITGEANYRFNKGWEWFIDLFGDKVKTSELSIILHMFSGNGVEYIPFDINGKSDKQIAANNVFADCLNLKAIPKITAKVSDVSYIFSNCKRLRELSEDAVANIDWSYIDSLTAPYSGARNATFNCCNSLRKFPMSFLRHGNPLAAYSVSIYNNCFYGCYSLDEVKGLPVIHTDAKWTSNAFTSIFNTCYRLKAFTFETNEDGSPIIVNNWSKQTIDLSKNVGWTQVSSYMIDYNSGITVADSVFDAATYEAKKNTENWYTQSTDYSRYNRTSAVETINSLPDLSGGAGGNTIKFKGAAGALTDGGAINTMTEEEIAVATAKGWTVSFA